MRSRFILSAGVALLLPAALAFGAPQRLERDAAAPPRSQAREARSQRQDLMREWQRGRIDRSRPAPAKGAPVLIPTHFPKPVPQLLPTQWPERRVQFLGEGSTPRPSVPERAPASPAPGAEPEALR